MRCERCGIDFEQARGKGRFCSRACWYAHLSESRPWVACAQCGTFFQIKPAKLAAGRGKYCSKWCEAAGRPMKPIADRFWPKVDKSGECWMWMGSKDRKGYGRISGGRAGEPPRLAHRVAYESAFGPIPEGLGVLHRCDNPGCVRPDHLFVGDQAANTADCVSKGRHAHGERTTGTKLTAADVMEIRARHAAGERQCDLARAYGVAPATIGDIVRRKRWAHVS